MSNAPMNYINPTWINYNYTYTIPAINPSTTVPLQIDLSTEKKKDSDGCACKKCREFYPYAEANQPDGTLVCYACRHGL